ncbi:MAG TPA: polymorphic toxin-type HINT domain-containing protein, partial [Candidatus Saccharimonadales bacterium]|nr:polymorphic toxin-type HINT domain-containing protein [Candidatus Saccharimonadales bacterium]
VVTTLEHPFWDGQKWVQAGDLAPGLSYVYGSDGARQKVLMIMKGQPSTVYNLEVSGTHNYYANELLVHNKIVE